MADTTNTATAPSGISDDETKYAFPAEDAPAAAAPKQVRWLTDKKRQDSYTLEWPFEYDGVEYRVITIRRMTFQEIQSFMDRMRETPDKNLRFPLYFVEGGQPISDEVWDIIEPDDKIKLTEIGTDFLPAMFRVQETAAPTTELGSDQAAGDISGNSSVA